LIGHSDMEEQNNTAGEEYSKVEELEFTDSNNLQKNTNTNFQLSQTHITILFFAILLILFSVTFIVCLIVLINKSSGTTVITRRFQSFTVEFDPIKSRTIRSIQHTWIHPGTRPSRNYFRPDPDFKLKNDDYIRSGFDKGHLSPWMILGNESQTIINVVPQIPCHNQQVWRFFEEYVRDNYKNRTIVTYPRYDDEKTFQHNGKIFYIPSHMCKVIEGVGYYCMEHKIETCVTQPSKNWCKLLTPQLPNISEECKFKH
jgi:hypothetical protein